MSQQALCDTLTTVKSTQVGDKYKYNSKCMKSHLRHLWILFITWYP